MILFLFPILHLFVLKALLFFYHIFNIPEFFCFGLILIAWTLSSNGPPIPIKGAAKIFYD